MALFLDFMTNVCKVRFQPTAFDDVGHNLYGELGLVLFLENSDHMLGGFGPPLWLVSGENAGSTKCRHWHFLELNVAAFSPG